VTASKRWLRIPIYYPGSVISVNHYKYSGGRYTKPEARQWMDTLACFAYMELKDYKVTMPVQIGLSARFKDNRSVCDLNNLHKLVADSLEMALGINDKHFRFHDRGYKIDKNADPEICVWVEVE